MNDEEFKRKLSEVAEWHIPKIKLDGVTRRKLRGRIPNETKYQDEHEQLFFEIYNGVNPTTTAPEITKVKPCGINCEDCGRDCPSGRTKEKKLFQTGKSHWREKCTTCGMNKNPWTGEFDLTAAKASAEWSAWLRKHVNKSEFKLKKSSVALPHSDREFDIESSDTGIIRKFVD